MKFLLNFLLVWVWGISLISLSACQDRSHILQGGHGDGDGGGDPQKPTQVPPHYDFDQFVVGSFFEFSTTTETLVNGKWVGEKPSCFLWKIFGVEGGLVELAAKKSIRCDGMYLKPEQWERNLSFEAESGKVQSDRLTVDGISRDGPLFEGKIFLYFFANGGEKDHFETVEALKIEGQAYPAFTINSVSYLNAPGTSLHGLLLQKVELAASKKQRTKWSLRQLHNPSPQ